MFRVKRPATTALVLVLFLAIGVGYSESGSFRLRSKSYLAATQAGAVPYSQKTGMCPNQLPLPSPPGAESMVRAYVQEVIPIRYVGVKRSGYKIEDLYLASTRHSDIFSQMAGDVCGETVRDRTWIAKLYFPAMEPSANVSQGSVNVSQSQLFVSLSPDGWKDWSRRACTNQVPIAS